MKNLIYHKEFLALLGTQVLGAFTDNFFRASFVTLVTYHLHHYSESMQTLFVSGAFGFFMLPSFIFSPIAGQLADRYDRSKIIKIVKASEILIVSLSTYGFIYRRPYILLLGLFCMAIPSAFFGPAKYGLLPDILLKDHLLMANGYIEASAFLAIMLGTLAGALMVQSNISLSILSFQLIVLSLLGFFISLYLPSVPHRGPYNKIRLSWLKEMKHLIHFVRKDERIFKSLICIAWFWLVETLILTELPSFSRKILNVDEGVFTFLLLLFAFGNGAGSILCGWIFKKKIKMKFVPLLALIMGPLLFDIAGFKSALSPSPLSLYYFLFTLQGMRLTFDFFCLSFLGGVYIVLLYTYIQTHVSPEHRSQVIALSNILNAGFIVFASLTSIVLFTLALSIPTLFLLISMGQLIVTIYVAKILIKGSKSV